MILLLSFFELQIWERISPALSFLIMTFNYGFYEPEVYAPMAYIWTLKFWSWWKLIFFYHIFHMDVSASIHLGMFCQICWHQTHTWLIGMGKCYLGTTGCFRFSGFIVSPLILLPKIVMNTFVPYQVSHCRVLFNLTSVIFDLITFFTIIWKLPLIFKSI